MAEDVRLNANAGDLLMSILKSMGLPSIKEFKVGCWFLGVKFQRMRSAMRGATVNSAFCWQIRKDLGRR